jgi:hypothetical protein
MPRTKTRFLLAAAAVVMVGASMMAIAQTRIDLKTQSKSVDFSSAQSTKPIKTGSALPPLCLAGEAYLLLTAVPGSNLYTCIATNTWVRQGGGSLPAAGTNTGMVLTNTGDTSYTWTEPSGDVTGVAPTRVTGMQGRSIADVEPVEGDVLTWTLTDGWRPSTNSSAVTVQLDGVTKGTRAVHNYVSGMGLLTSAYDSANALVFQNSINTAIVQTRANAQSGTDTRLVITGSDGTTFAAAMTPTLTAYSDGMVVQFRPDQNCSGAATLNIDTLGAKNLFESQGATAITCAAGEQIPIWYDSTANDNVGGWRKQGAASGSGVLDGPKGEITVAGDVWTVGSLPSSRVGLANVSNFGTASQAEAEAGSAADKYMTPERTKQAILALAPHGAALTDGVKGEITVAGDVWTVGSLPSSRVGLANVSNFGTASQAEAEAGSAADKYMTPQRTKQAVTVLAPRYVEYPGAKCFSGAAATPLSLPVTGAPSATCATGANSNGGVLQFSDDGATVISAQDAMVLTGTLISVDIWWRANVADAALNAVWEVQTACVAPGQDGDPAWNPPQDVISAAHTTANRWRKATILSVTATGCATGNVMRWKLSRNPANAADTLSATADLISILWTLQRGAE